MGCPVISVIYYTSYTQDFQLKLVDSFNSTNVSDRALRRRGSTDEAGRVRGEQLVPDHRRGVSQCVCVKGGGEGDSSS